MFTINHKQSATGVPKPGIGANGKVWIQYAFSSFESLFFPKKITNIKVVQKGKKNICSVYGDGTIAVSTDWKWFANITGENF